MPNTYSWGHAEANYEAGLSYDYYQWTAFNSNLYRVEVFFQNFEEFSSFYLSQEGSDQWITWDGLGPRGAARRRYDELNVESTGYWVPNDNPGYYSWTYKATGSHYEGSEESLPPLDRISLVSDRSTSSGTNSPEAIFGSSEDDSFMAHGGSDFLEGNNGNDNLHGNKGADHLLGGNGDDTLRGGFGADTIKGGEGSDRIWGGLGKNNIDAGYDEDRDEIFISVDETQNLLCGNPDGVNADYIENLSDTDVVHFISDTPVEITMHQFGFGAYEIFANGTLEATLWFNSAVNISDHLIF